MFPSELDCDNDVNEEEGEKDEREDVGVEADAEGGDHAVGDGNAACLGQGSETATATSQDGHLSFVNTSDDDFSDTSAASSDSSLLTSFSTNPFSHYAQDPTRRQKRRLTNSSLVQQCPSCTGPLSALASKLPFAHFEGTKLVCFLSGKAMDENNPPMVFPNGFVYSLEVPMPSLFSTPAPSTPVHRCLSTHAFSITGGGQLTQRGAC